MSKKTTKYQLGYFEEGDITSSIIEMQRWEAIDIQLYSLFAILGNGVIEGWSIMPSSGLSIAVSPGEGHVAFVAVKSTENIILSGLEPYNRNYIYVSLTTSSYWDQSISIVSRLTLNTDQLLLYIGYVDTDSTQVTHVNIDDRVYLGFINLITTLVSEHRHIGGEGNPPPVNLASEVQGIINQKNLPDLDASIIQTGTLNANRFPVLDHITKLVNQGTLTHAQLDSFVEALSIENATLMGETSTINLLQLVLALKHVYPDIDQYLINEIAYIPGISPDSYVDWENTTAVVDILPYSEGGQHTITGLPAPAKKAYTYSWNTQEQFNSGSQNNVLVSGNQVTLDTQETKLVIDEFSDLSQWEVITTDLSSTAIALSQDASTYVEPPNSAKLEVGNQTVEIALIIKKTFDATDWSQYGKLVFYLNTDSVQHGDVYFYLNDTNAGTQNSHIKVLNRNNPTINIDTLQNGWQEVTIDISSYTRTNIDTIGFYISSQEGWDTSKSFDLNIDNIYLTTGVLYKSNGYIREIFGGDFLYDFWRVRWDAIIPTDSQSTGVSLRWRTRVGNTLADLNQSIWSSYSSTSGSDIILPAPGLYQYIEIEAYFTSSNDYTRSAYLRKLYLDFYASDVDGSFNYDSKVDWDSGSKFNIDTSTVEDSMLISNTDEINNIFYGTDSKAVQLDEDLNELYSVSGSLLPRSTYQVQNSLSPSLGLLTGVARGNNGNFWICDTDNDRILELDKSGALITAFYGSFLSLPIDEYGTEDSGPGSNITDDSDLTTTSTTTMVLGASLDVLQAIYNSDTGVIYVVFDSNLENIYASDSKLNINRFYVKIGTQKFYLNDSIVELLGVDEDKYNDWFALTTSEDSSAKFINQFTFSSHVLKITLQGADKTLLNYMVDDMPPSVVISTPYEQEQVDSSATVKFLVYNFDIGTKAGENGIKVTLDGVLSQVIYDSKITFNGLSVGKHTIQAQLINADGSLNTNIEAVADSSFVVVSSTYSQPYVSIITPKPNQIYSSSPVVVEFDVENFPILATGQHVRYFIDAESPIDYYSEQPITLEDVSAGEHTITVYLVDKWGNDLGYTYGTAVGSFIVGANSSALAKLYIDSNAIYNSELNITNNDIRIWMDVGNIYFCNIYSPIDVQIIPCETGVINPDGLPTVVIAKLRSPSWTDGLAGEANVTEMMQRIANVASNNLSTVLTGTPTAELIYGTKYLDGHSVVQMTLDGNVIMSNNAAIFAKTKEEAKTLLGSVEKLGETEFLIADSYNKRAIITYTNVNSQATHIQWQYDSDKYIFDFHIVAQDNVVIGVNNDAIDESEVFIRQGTNIIWQNNSTIPVSIYSGTTTYDQFILDPDLTLYGDEFKSEVIEPGERYMFKFGTVGEYNWFVYPGILTGKITVTRNRISSRDEFLILENDGLSSPFTSRVIKTDSMGNITWDFGSSYMVLPRDARPLLNGNVIIST